MTFLIADDHALVRRALARQLAELTGFQAEEAGNGFEAIEIVKSKPIDLVILDVQMPLMDGRTAFLELRKINPELKIIILTFLTGIENLLFFIHHRANGFLAKDDELSVMLNAIEAVMLGNKFYNEAALRAMKITMPNIPQTIARLHLTPREMDLLKGLQKGLSNKEMADKLNLSARTIEAYRDKLFEKTGTHNSAELIMFALQNGILND